MVAYRLRMDTLVHRAAEDRPRQRGLAALGRSDDRQPLALADQEAGVGGQAVEPPRVGRGRGAHAVAGDDGVVRQPPQEQRAHQFHHVRQRQRVALLAYLGEQAPVVLLGEVDAALLQAVREEGSATVETLAQRFQVTLQTVRRDVALLAAAGLLARFHGGVRGGHAQHLVHREVEVLLDAADRRRHPVT